MGRWLAWVLLAVLPWVASSGCREATEPEPSSLARRFEVPYHGRLVLEVPAGWRESVRRSPGGQAPTIVFSPPSGDAFSMAVAVRWDLGDDEEFNSPARLRKLVEREVGRLKGSIEEEEPQLEEIAGERTRGYLFSVTHRPPDLPDGKYPHRTQGAIALDDLLLGVTLLMREDDAELRAGALNMLAGALREGHTTTVEELSDRLSVEDGRLINRSGGYSFDVPEGWSLRDVSNPQLVIVEREGLPTAFSILVKPARGGLLEELEFLKRGLLAAPGSEIVSEAGDEIGGVDSVRLVTRRVVEGTPVLTRNYVAVSAGASYFLGLEMPESLRETLEPDLERMLDSFRFDEPPGS